jgi:MoaA/NifB/PqqE/SkfB family radical SAM enzyme
MNIKNKKYFCYEIYKNLAVWSHNGTLGYNPCSFFKGYIKTNEKFQLDDIWNSPEHQQLKFQIENDLPIEGCQRCYQAEQQGLESRRQGSKKLYEDFLKDTKIDLDGPSGIDYSVGNLCNLKCVICGPNSSSKWISDYKKLYPLKPIDHLKYKKYDQLQITDVHALQNIKSVHFHGGGEPLLSNSHVELLKNIKQIKGLADVRVFYNTNATQTVSDEVLQLWSECKLVELYFSIDDVNHRFNYQRTGADWAHVLKNLDWFYNNMPDNHMFNVNCVWSYLNLFYLDELADWHKKFFSTNRFGDETKLIFQKAIGIYAIDHWSSRAYVECNTKFENYPELLEIIHTLKIMNSDHQKFWSNISKLDAIRNTNFESLCPEWSKLLK